MLTREAKIVRENHKVMRTKKKHVKLVNKNDSMVTDIILFMLTFKICLFRSTASFRGTYEDFSRFPLTYSSFLVMLKTQFY